MAGVIGIFGYDNIWKMARFTYYGLMALQHRGQETCGIATYDGKTLTDCRSTGLVDQAFNEETIEKLPGSVGIGHVSSQPSNGLPIQPVVVEEPVRLALCYDGMILNHQELLQGHNGGGAVALAQLLSNELSEAEPMEAVSRLFQKAKGPFSFVALTDRGEMLAARDPSGLRPLVVGNFGFDYGVISSESCALDVIGADFKSDVQPGEAYVFTSWNIERKQIAKPKGRFCAFEYVYLARPDSILNGSSVYSTRIKIGEQLAEEHSNPKADVVIGVPETATPASMAYANKTRKPIGMGFIQTGRRMRSAIRPTQFERLVGVQLKLNPIRSALAGKRIVLVDDSVVRGTTTKNTVNIMRNKMGAKEVHVRIGSPRLVDRCPFGVEVPPKDELIAANLNEEEVSKVVGADTFHWLSLKGLSEAIGLPMNRLCVGCFTGKYPEIGMKVND